MAVEAVRHHFDPADTKLSWRDRRKAGEAAMCERLRISASRLEKLEGKAAPGRHGERVYTVDWEMRRDALEFAWEIVRRFDLHLGGDDGKSWASIT